MNKQLKTIQFLEKEAKKTIEWYKGKRWVRIAKILSTIDYLLVNENTDLLTQEILLRLSVTIEQLQHKMKSNVMPLKAFKIILKPIKIILKKESLSHLKNIYNKKEK